MAGDVVDDGGDRRNPLKDERGLRNRRRAGGFIAVLCVVAAIVTMLVGGAHRFVFGLAWLIGPLVIGLEAVSTRQYHRYRSGLMAMIRGKMDKENKAVKKATKDKTATPGEAPQGKAFVGPDSLGKPPRKVTMREIFGARKITQRDLDRLER